jgi:hypothetical protein
VIVFKNPKNSKSSYTEKLGSRGITLDIYLNGDEFTF